MRIPKDIRESIDAWSDRDDARWYALTINSDNEVAIKHYDNGESVATFGRAGGQYCLWSVHRGQAIETYPTASALWSAVRAMIRRGPDRFGLAQV